jgi:hypothetical protein
VYLYRFLDSKNLDKHLLVFTMSAEYEVKYITYAFVNEK